jgi:hypothetical protein
VLTLLLAVRVFWVPMHLALHAHDFGHAGISSHSHGADEHAHEHEHEHDGDRDHSPHAAADHLTHLIVSRVSPELSGAWLPLAESPLLDTPEPAGECAPRLTLAPPRPPPPRACRARAPPLG